MATALQELIEIRIGRPLDEWLSEHKDPKRGYSDLAVELRLQYGIRVSGESLRRWHNPVAEPEPAAA